jgi:SPP1 family predicted phage head-tail adaptor
MDIGQFDRTIELFSPAAAIDDGYTSVLSAYASQGTRKAKYIPAMRREIFEAAGREVKLPAIFEVRSDSLTRTVNEKWRISFDGNAYDVKGVQPVGRRQFVRIEAMAADNGL